MRRLGRPRAERRPGPPTLAERAARSEGESPAAQAQLTPKFFPIQRTPSRRAVGERGLPQDRLRSIKRANEPYDLVRNYYDAQGEKTISLHPGATSTEEVFHAGALTLRADGNSYATTKHIYAGGQRLASKMDHRWFTEDPVQYYATDHLGSTNFTFDSVGNVISHTEYFPSGEIWRSETLASHSGINQYQFTGKEWDDVTGLYDFGYRSYDPVVGQWLSPDPAFDGLNVYAYVHNNPVNMVDPFGLSAVRGEDSQITWSNRTLDDNGVTSHFEDGEFHDPYRDDSGVQAPTYDDFRQQAYEDARNQQRAEAYIKSNENDLNQLRYEPLEYKGFTPQELEYALHGVMAFNAVGELAVGLASLRGMSLLSMSKLAPEVTAGAAQVGKTLNATVGKEAANVVRDVLKGRQSLTALTGAQRQGAAAFYRDVATRVGGREAAAAARYNVARAEFLEGTRATLPPSLPDFIKLGL